MEFSDRHGLVQTREPLPGEFGELREDPSHWGDPEFEEFVAKELEKLAERADAKGICIACLSDRLIFEIVAGLARSGVSEGEIFDIVQDALDDVDEDAELEVPNKGPSRRVH